MGQLRDEKLLRKIAMSIKKLREERSLSQETVYHETDIHIARIETAKADIRVSTLSRLCDYFGISLADFFGELEK